MFKKDLQEIKKSQSLVNNAITVTKNTLKETKGRMTVAEEKFSELRNRMEEIIDAEKV